MKYCIVVKNGEKIYSKNDTKIVALNKINIKFEENKIYVIMGNSGAGKSTLLQNIGLLDNLTSGDIIIDGTHISKMTEKEKANIRRDKIGFIFQSFYLNPYMKAYENVMLPLLLNKSLTNADKKEKAIKLLNEVGLKDRINHFPKELSGGEQQRVAIARSLANGPKIILADEPTGNLDRKNEELIMKIFKKLKNHNKCIIIVSHNEKIKEYADEVIYMKDGNIYYEDL